MLAALNEGGGVVTLLPAAPPPPPLAPAPPVAQPSAQVFATAAEARNANGETLTEAEAAVLREVAAGSLGADALARHPLPPGTSQAEALRFLASLPQTTYTLGQPGGTVTGPPIDTLAGNPPAEPSVDVGGGGDGRELETAYRPAGVAAEWRRLVDVFRVAVPAQHAKVDSAGKALLGVFK